MTGAWGFVPDAYLAFVKAQAVEAIATAVSAMRPAVVREGAVITPGPCDGKGDNILDNQFNCDEPPENTVDTEVRVLQATAAGTGAPIATVANFAAHATVGGPDNTLVSADWPGALAEQLTEAYGGVGMTLVADVGRSQPNARDCITTELGSGRYAVDARSPKTSCAMSSYAARVKAYAEQAVVTARRLKAGPVRSASFFLRDPSHSAALLGLDYAGDPAGAPIARQYLPPYLAGDAIGTWVSDIRVGNMLLTTNPGEAYPNIRDGVMAQVGDARRFWTVGLANDQLGYLISPLPDAYPILVRHAPEGNDNYLFNVSHTIGDHVMCVQVRLAAEVGYAAHPTPRCQAFMAETNPAGADGSPPPA
jgi:hypothetical protein